MLQKSTPPLFVLTAKLPSHLSQINMPPSIFASSIPKILLSQHRSEGTCYSWNKVCRDTQLVLSNSSVISILTCVPCCPDPLDTLRCSICFSWLLRRSKAIEQVMTCLIFWFCLVFSAREKQSCNGLLISF